MPIIFWWTTTASWKWQHECILITAALELKDVQLLLPGSHKEANHYYNMLEFVLVAPKCDLIILQINWCDKENLT